MNAEVKQHKEGKAEWLEHSHVNAWEIDRCWKYERICRGKYENRKIYVEKNKVKKEKNEHDKSVKTN